MVVLFVFVMADKNCNRIDGRLSYFKFIMIYLEISAFYHCKFIICIVKTYLVLVVVYKTHAGPGDDTASRGLLEQ